MTAITTSRGQDLQSNVRYKFVVTIALLLLPKGMLPFHNETAEPEKVRYSRIYDLSLRMFMLRLPIA